MLIEHVETLVAEARRPEGTGPGLPAYVERALRATGFDTISGAGQGRIDGVAGFQAALTMTEAGVPDGNDHVSITLTDAAGNVVLVVDGVRATGNNDAQQ